MDVIGEVPRVPGISSTPNLVGALNFEASAESGDARRAFSRAEERREIEGVLQEGDDDASGVEVIKAGPQRFGPRVAIPAFCRTLHASHNALSNGLLVTRVDVAQRRGKIAEIDRSDGGNEAGRKSAHLSLAQLSQLGRVLDIEALSVGRELDKDKGEPDTTRVLALTPINNETIEEALVELCGAHVRFSLIPKDGIDGHTKDGVEHGVVEHLGLVRRVPDLRVATISGHSGARPGLNVGSTPVDGHKTNRDVQLLEHVSASEPAQGRKSAPITAADCLRRRNGPGLFDGAEFVQRLSRNEQKRG